MSEVKEYRVKGIVKAEKVEKACTLVTENGPGWANEGDYLVYQDDGGVLVVDADTFESVYTVNTGDSEFHPAGNTVEEVISFLKANPDQVDRVKAEEATGANRKGIADFTE